MPYPLVPPDWIAGRADVLPPPFVRALAFIDSSGVHAIVTAGMRARQLAHRLLVLRGPPNVDRVLRLAGHRDDVEVHELDPIDPPVQALVQLAEADLAS